LTSPARANRVGLFRVDFKSGQRNARGTNPTKSTIEAFFPAASLGVASPIRTAYDWGKQRGLIYYGTGFPADFTGFSAEFRVPIAKKAIEKATVHIAGDPSVGIPHQQFEVEVFLDREDDEHVESFRAALAGAYELMGGEPASVQFDFEAQAERELEERLDAESSKIEADRKQVKRAEHLWPTQD
jgi:hypothetical protein